MKRGSGPFTYDERAIIDALDKLPRVRRTAFAATIAERMLPAFLAHAASAGEDASALRQILDRLWLDLADDPMKNDEVQSALERCMKALPDEDAPGWTPGRTYANDAGAALAYALRARLSGLSQEAAWAARRAYDSVDHFAQTDAGIDTNAPGAEFLILSNPVVQAELGRQRRDLVDLASAESDGDVLARLRTRAKGEGREFFAPVVSSS